MDITINSTDLHIYQHTRIFWQYYVWSPHGTNYFIFSNISCFTASII